VSGRPDVPGSCFDASGFGQDVVFAQFGDGVVKVAASAVYRIAVP
jgi:hypothetical protein